MTDSDLGIDGNLDLQFGNESGNLQDSSNFQSIMNNTPNEPNIQPNSQYDRSFSFDSDGNDSSGFPETSQPPRPKSPKSRYDYFANDVPLSQPTPPRSNSPEDDYPDYGDGGSPELSSLFSLISNFQPNPVEMTVHWKPFLPELVPAIGTIDAFIKVPRPDSEIDDLGLVILDEPSISQSNPQILRMELREQYGITTPDNQSDAYIGCIENPQKNLKALNAWLESIEEIHRNRPPVNVIYNTKMPELEELMEPWPDEFENVLKSVVLPSADMDISLEEYAKIICALLEIPVRGNLIESLHVLFSLYAQFEGNQYFQSQRQPTPT
ncbi:Intraflagellar transport protein 46 [Tritrichomonas foetus]|uniref:Intraflagellar transport protein 46 n=1 Tax=Tritrichomonas foetus TaxID=1144522 RepID=A0A1J4K172_9EUKA|nr:Intraflagellar transport protein 46 [Tritrichomonas foetus]|eukprot:OHT03502.1 Intraflagellar transport protein 46 [Tritrichomonas foetus]